MEVTSPICCILPPHILRKLSENPRYHDRALRNFAITERLRGRRHVLAQFAGLALAPGNKRRTIYDAQHATSEDSLPGQLVRGEGDPDVADISVNEAYGFSGDTYDFYDQVFGRNSIDGQGMRLDSSVHFGQDYDNAFWDGRQMVYGDGDGQFFDRFTKCIDVVGHELTHGVTASTAQLTYQGQSGALNESFSDVFGSLVKQRKLGQSAAQADWLIGQGLWLPTVQGAALRSMAAPGTAYNDPNVGQDPQPGNMKDYVNTLDDNGGVHINSGIPNHAFYLVSMKIGGNAWEKPGQIWYTTLTQKLTSSATFQDAADVTYAVAGDLFGVGSLEQQAVRDSWQEVGLTVGEAPAAQAAAVSAASSRPSLASKKRGAA